jgi:teichoic acid transport system ATP-binding protein
LNPDIFIIDEALAVGDLDFQTKCIKKMRWHQERGATILLVSHSDVQIREFCGKALWLNTGMLEYDGTSEEAVLLYRSSSTRRAGYQIKKIGLPENLENDYECKITDVTVMVKDTCPFNSLEVIVTFDIKKERQGNLSMELQFLTKAEIIFLGQIPI